MKIYTHLVIDMNTDEVLHEESYNYEGPVALAFGGGGSGGQVKNYTGIQLNSNTYNCEFIDGFHAGANTFAKIFNNMNNKSLKNFAVLEPINPAPPVISKVLISHSCCFQHNITVADNFHIL